MKRNKYIDHTLLKPEATAEQIDRLCREAAESDFASVCVNPCWVTRCANNLKDTDVDVCTVIGFPLGANTSLIKAVEAQNAMANGADELDMVINVGELKAGNDKAVFADIQAVRDAAPDAVLKVILETCLLTDEEIVRACELCVKAHADFVKTSTGFNKGGATEHAVALMKKTVKDKAKVKAAGGIRTPEDMDRMIEAGADRIGTSNGKAML